MRKLVLGIVRGIGYSLGYISMRMAYLFGGRKLADRYYDWMQKL